MSSRLKAEIRCFNQSWNVWWDVGRIFSEILEHARCRAYWLPKPYLGISFTSLFFLIFHFLFSCLKYGWLGLKKTTKPVSKQFSDYCYYFSFINYWCNYVNQSIQSTGPSYSETSTRTRTGTESRILTIEPDNLMDNNYSCLTKIFLYELM